MSFFRSLLPGALAPNPQARVDTQDYRERLLQTILIGAALIGAGLLALTLPVATRQGLWVLVGVYAIIYAWILVATLLRRRLPYGLRAASLLVILYALGLSGLLSMGLAGDGPIYFFGLVVITAVLFGLRPGLAALLTSGATLFVVGWLMSAGRIPTPSAAATTGPAFLSTWAGSSAVLLVLAALTITGLGVIVSGLNQSLTQQIRLADELGAQRTGLDERIRESTANVERRLTQLRTAAEVSRRISAELDPKTLLDQVVILIQERFDLYYAGVFLVDERGLQAELRAGSGEAGRKMLAEQHRLAISESSMVGWSILHRMPRIALDVGAEAVRFNNPHLPLTRSEMALPLVSGDHALGAISIQSEAPDAFDEDDILVLQGIADALAIALENARLYQQAQESLDEIRTLHHQYLQKAWSNVHYSPDELQYTYEDEKIEDQDGALFSVQVPLTLREQVIGQVTLETGRPVLTPDELDLAEAVVAQAALAVESARLLEETQRRIGREELLNQIASRFTRAIDVETILKEAVQGLGRLPQVKEVSVVLDAPGPGFSPGGLPPEE